MATHPSKATIKVHDAHTLGEAVAAQDPSIVHLGAGYITRPVEPLPEQLGITLYIAGPMTGHPEFNYPAFHRAAKELRAAGYRVLNPAETPTPCRNPSWDDWMRAAIALLIQADHVATLDGWEHSKGAQVEVNLALGLGMSFDPVARHLHVAAKIAGTR